MLILAMPVVASDLELPVLLSEHDIAAFRARYPGSPVLLPMTWVGYDLSYQRRRNGIFGDCAYLETWLVGSSKGIEEISRVFAEDSPGFRWKRFRVELIHADGSTEKFDRDDLHWFTAKPRRRGIVTLDGTQSAAVIPGIRVGDRVRKIWTYELRGAPGVPPVVLGGSDVPTLEAELILQLPADYQVDFRIVGPRETLNALERSDEPNGGRKRIRFSLSLDPNETSDCDIASGFARITPHVLDAGLGDRDAMAVGTSWQSVGSAYLSEIDAILEPNKDVRKLAERLAEDVSTDDEYIDKVYSYVQRNCRYLGLYEGRDGIIPASPHDVLESGYGDCKGLGTLIISLLRVRGLQAHPVLVRTAPAGRLHTDLPNMAQFNHYIVWIDDGGDGVWVDGTAECTPVGWISPWAATNPVLVLEPGDIRVVEIPREHWEPGGSRYDLVGTLLPTGQLDYRIRWEVVRAASTNHRAGYAKLTDQQTSDLIRSLLMPEDISVRSTAPLIDGEDRWEETLSHQLHVTSDSALPASGRSHYLPKMMVPRAAAEFDSPRCSWSIDLSDWESWHESWNFELPDGWSLAAPDSAQFEARGLRWSRRIWMEDGHLHLEREIEFEPITVTDQDADEFRETLRSARRAESGFFELLENR